MSPLCVLVLCEIFFYAGGVETYEDFNLIQTDGIQTAIVGDNTKLRCACERDSVTFFSWYQQTLGGKPQLISSRMKHNTKADILSEYKDRFDVYGRSEGGINDLKITNLQLSDTAMYYCGVLVFSAIKFGPGVFLHVKPTRSLTRATVIQPAVAPFDLGQVGNLTCTVHSKPCGGRQELYWFRHGASEPATLYPSEGQCRTEEPHGRTCTSNISVKALRPSHAAIYYCAALTCGEIVFGNGTKVEIGGSTRVDTVLVSFLGTALTVSIAVLVVLSFVACKLRRRSCSVGRGAVSHQAPPAASDALSPEENTLHYAALSVRKNGERLHPQENVCVYSRIKTRKE